MYVQETKSQKNLKIMNVELKLHLLFIILNIFIQTNRNLQSGHFQAPVRPGPIHHTLGPVRTVRKKSFDSTGRAKFDSTVPKKIFLPKHAPNLFFFKPSPACAGLYNTIPIFADK